MELTAYNVKAVFRDCLFREGEDTTNPAIVEGIKMNVYFHRKRLASRTEDIASMLSMLPSGFRKEVGGGMSFLSACVTEEGEQWTGSHQTMERLFSLGQACGMVESVLPREEWRNLHGGMPYYATIAPRRSTSVRIASLGQTNEVHLCLSCQNEYPVCDSMYLVFGTGKGNDNIAACNTYVPIRSRHPGIEDNVGS